MNERHIQTADARESYYAPTYDLFLFESSDLILTSEDDHTIDKGFLGDAGADESSVESTIW